MGAWVVQSGRWLHRKRKFPNEDLARGFYDGLVERLARSTTKVCAVLIDPTGATAATYQPGTGTVPALLRERTFEPGDAVEFARAIGLPSRADVGRRPLTPRDSWHGAERPLLFAAGGRRPSSTRRQHHAPRAVRVGRGGRIGQTPRIGGGMSPRFANTLR